jgi:hypothetical protein
MKDNEDESKPPTKMISQDFDDLRAYMPKLSFRSENQIGLNNAKTQIEIEGKIIENANDIVSAFENLEKRRTNALATLN